MDYFAYFDYFNVFSEGSIMKRSCQGLMAIWRRRLPKIWSQRFERGLPPKTI
jgi:hypothetical protein